MMQFADSMIHWVHSVFGAEVDWKQMFLTAMTPFFLGAFAIELYIQNKKGDLSGFHPKEVIANLSLGASYQFFEGVMWLVMGTYIFGWAYDHRLWTVPVNVWTIIPIFVAVEFCFYWMHRASHRIRWFWTAHVPHHSGEHMNFTTAMRQSLLNAFVGVWVFFVGLCLLGVHPVAVMVCFAVNLAYQYFVHTETIGKLPRWFEYVFNTPSHHRVHHGRNPQYIDKNYGGTLIIFDRMFGTFEPEVEPVQYGIVHQIRSYNFLILNLHEMVDLLRDVMAPGKLSERLKHFIMPPEWERSGHEAIHTWTVEQRVDQRDNLRCATDNHLSNSPAKALRSA